MYKALFRGMALFGVYAALPVWSGCGAKGCSILTPAPAPRARLIEIIATEYHLNPSRIYAEPGEALIISLRNDGAERHDLAFDLGPSGEHTLEWSAYPGETRKMTITAPKEPGDFSYYSPLGGRRGLGMQGTLTVAPAPVVRLEEVARGLSAPVSMAVPNDASGRRFIVDQVGVIRVLAPGSGLRSRPFLDLRDRLAKLDSDHVERGLLGLAFHPRYAQNGRFFVYYTAPPAKGAPGGFDHTAHVSELRVSPTDPDLADPASERVLLAIDHPQKNHVAGVLAFGADGLLYIAEGDGGGCDDRGPGHASVIGNAQDVTSLLGKILRIDVDRGAPYGIPADNPFAICGGAPEIYAWGFRDPYRFSFDASGAHQLFAGDAGQGLWQEVSIVERGGNYGFRILEGTHCVGAGPEDERFRTCPRTGRHGEPLRFPVIELPGARQEGGYAETIVGGYVYRGAAIPELSGQYVFGVSSLTQGQREGALFMASAGTPSTDLWPVRRIRVEGAPCGDVGSYVRAFGEDEENELYVLTSDAAGPCSTTGRVFRLVRHTGG